MNDDARSTTRLSRRGLLAGGGAVAIAASAGCFDAVLSSGPRPIDPEEPSEPRAGTPGEFYTLLEWNDLAVASLTREEETLYLTYESTAETEDESIEEMGIIVQVFNANLVENDAGVETLIAEITNPFDGQAHGWGLEAWWLEEYNRGNADEQFVWGSVLSSRVDGNGEQLAAPRLERTDEEMDVEDDDE